jgi:hypothetical protein
MDIAGLNTKDDLARLDSGPSKKITQQVWFLVREVWGTTTDTASNDTKGDTARLDPSKEKKIAQPKELPRKPIFHPNETSCSISNRCWIFLFEHIRNHPPGRPSLFAVN